MGPSVFGVARHIKADDFNMKLFRRSTTIYNDSPKEKKVGIEIALAIVLQNKKKKMKVSPSMDTPNAHNAELTCRPTQKQKRSCKIVESRKVEIRQ